MVRAEDLDPEALKQPRSGRRTQKATPGLEEFIEIFPGTADPDIDKCSLGNVQISEAFKQNGWDPGGIKNLKDLACKERLLVCQTGAHNRQRFIRTEVLRKLNPG